MGFQNGQAREVAFGIEAGQQGLLRYKPLPPSDRLYGSLGQRLDFVLAKTRRWAEVFVGRVVRLHLHVEVRTGPGRRKLFDSPPHCGARDVRPAHFGGIPPAIRVQRGSKGIIQQATVVVLSDWPWARSCSVVEAGQGHRESFLREGDARG